MLVRYGAFYMNRPRSQTNSAPNRAPNFSQQDGILQHAEPLLPRGRDSGLGNRHQITKADTLSKNGQNNGTIQRRIQDHPLWSAYLADRHILEEATAAAWVEREDWTRQDVLVWREKRRDGGPGATRRRLLKQVSVNGKKPQKVRWQFRGSKTDEPFHYLGSIDELKQAIADAGCQLNIVEGEFDVWSMNALGFPNTVGIYGINNIPKDIASILDELGIAGFTYFADNDKAGARGASNLRTLLHGSGWTGVQEYRKFAGPGIPHRGDANDLLCHHFPDIAGARTALAALPRFSPRIKPQTVHQPSTEIDHGQERWKPVNEAIRLELGVDGFKANGFSKNISCPNPQHEDKTPSAGWHEGGYLKCFSCGTFPAKQVAEWLGIDWRALIRPQLSTVSPKNIDLDAAPQQTEAEPAPLSFENAPDTWLGLLIKFYASIDAVLFFFALHVCSAGPLAQGFTRREFIAALRELKCNVSERAIYYVFEEVFEHDNHPVFAKIDPGEGSSARNCKFQLRGLDDIRRLLLQGISYRVYEDKFRQHRDILIGFQVFAEAIPGSKFAITLESALEPLYMQQKQRFESLKYLCEQKIAAYQADLENLHATPLPDWTIDKPSELPALLARGIYAADLEDRSKTVWARLLGISKASVADTLKRAGIKRRADILRVEVDSQGDAKKQAWELSAKILGIEAEGGYLPYEAAMDIPQGSVAILQPPARHEIVSDEKQIINAPPATPRVLPPGETTTVRADNMGRPGNWHKPSWDPQFIYWELVKACCLLHGYQVKDGIGLYNPQTGEVWPNPTLHELISLITGQPAAADPTTKPQLE